MDSLLSLISQLISQTLQQPVGLLFVVIAAGILLGRVPLGRFYLGGSGVLIAGLVFGHYGFLLPREIQTIGVVLFVYSIGLRAGPNIVQSLKKSNSQFLMIALCIVASAAVIAFLLKRVFGFAPEIISGLYAGAMTSTPALAAAMETLGDSTPSVGYGLAYPLGILGVIILVQVLPLILKINLKDEEKKFQENSNAAQILRQAFRVTNPNVTQKPLEDSLAALKGNFRIVRVKRGESIFHLYPDQCLEMGDIVLAVGKSDTLRQLEIFIGETVEEEVPASTEAQSKWMVMASKKFIGKKIGNLEISHLYGVIISRIRRSGIEFVPSTNFTFEAGDEVRVSGTPDDLIRFEDLVRRDREILHETDIFSFSVGLALGVLVGLIKIPITQELSLSLGIAGGPLVVGLLLGYAGRFGQITGHMPKAAKLLVGELGLYLFLAVAGCAAGEHFFEVLREQGLALIFSGFLITIAPILVATLAAHFVLKINFLMMLGMICGGMTSTPALGVISSNTKSDIPALGYAGIYPLAVLLTTFAAQILAKM